MSSEPEYLAAFETIPLASEEWGVSAPRIALIHGLGDGGFVWDALVSYLGPDLEAIAWDLRGHAESPWDAFHRYDGSSFAADVVAEIERRDLRELTLIGHSLGAEVAIRAAAACATRVNGIVIIDGGPELDARGGHAVRRNLEALPRRYERVADLEKALVDRYPLSDAQVLSRYAASALRPTAQGLFELKFDPALHRGLPAPDTAAIWAALDRLACPKLLIRGAISSMLSRERALNVSRRTRDCRLTTVPQAGHSVLLDNPRGLHAAIMPFLATVSSCPSGSDPSAAL